MFLLQYLIFFTFNKTSHILHKGLAVIHIKSIVLFRSQKEITKTSLLCFKDIYSFKNVLVLYKLSMTSAHAVIIISVRPCIVRIFVRHAV
jgi:hypothetical protein